ncbi:3-hydroxybutyrate dehydrogenase [Leucothrix arctica]|uniref:3-hydroxybutyrate dehydrogenase n=1 Tax=Leucothrix arctica TaxID=1481894 RepID=A0A317C2Q6_9GAMM|nr:3-hydroxybutyrate dehydrogenase [Leucothrix arctica]PWQ92966.1 3-hydroxybutyrate dehydrogenase [Leucothrix arctica]
MRKLEGKTALVTGSTSGIGLGIAQRLANEGANIALNGFGDLDEIESIRVAIEESNGVTVRYFPSDLTQVDQIEAMMLSIAQELGCVDILVNNAGMQHVSPVEDFPVASWDKVIALNLSAVFHTTRLLIPAMKENRWGRIINIASAHALIASPYKSAYVSAKHGVAGFTKSVALEVAGDGVTVNAICPGYVWTPLVEKQIPDTAKARGLTEEQVVNDVLLARQPTKAFVTVDQVAAYASFLCGDEAASITGSLQSIDGGWTAS